MRSCEPALRSSKSVSFIAYDLSFVIHISRKDFTIGFLCKYGFPSHENLYKSGVFKFCMLCFSSIM